MVKRQLKQNILISLSFLSSFALKITLVPTLRYIELQGS